MPTKFIADLTQPLGLGDKKILRLIGLKMGLVQRSCLVKRAIQFGSRISKHSNTYKFGSNEKGKNKIKNSSGKNTKGTTPLFDVV